MRTKEQISAHQRALSKAHKYFDDVVGKRAVTEACRYKPHRELTRKQRERALAEIVSELGLENINE